MTKRRLSLLGVLAALALFAAACGDDSDTADDDSTDAGATTEDEGDADASETDDAEADEEAPDEDEADGDSEEASGEPILIGALTSLTGNFTPWGIQVVDGMQLAVDEINADGGVDGRPLELVTVDDQSDPEEAIQGFERLVDDGVIGMAGTISSGVGLATADLAEELETPLFLVKAGSEEILTTDSRYTFRTCLPPAPSLGDAIAQYVEAEGITRVGAVIADYAWGQSMQSALEGSVEALDGVEVQYEVAPVGEQDFTTYLRGLQDFDPELIVATGHPPGSGAITVQSADLGFEVPVTGAYSPQAGVVGNAADAAIGRYADFNCTDPNSAEYAELAERYLEFSDNTFMEGDAAAGYAVVHALAESVAEVGDDPVAIAEHLHANTFEGYALANDLSWTEWGEMAAVEPVFHIISEGPAPEGLNEAGEWWFETLRVSDPLDPYEPS